MDTSANGSFTRLSGDEMGSNRVSDSQDTCRPKNVSKSSSSFSTREREQEKLQTTVQLKLHSMNCLLDILVTLSRIGAEIVYVSAKANSAIVSVSANPFIVRRVPKLLRELVEVIELEEFE